MKTIKFSINYGGYIGCDDEYEIDVDDSMTQDEIDEAVDEKFQEIITDNCSWEIITIEEDN